MGLRWWSPCCSELRQVRGWRGPGLSDLGATVGWGYVGAPWVWAAPVSQASEGDRQFRGQRFWGGSVRLGGRERTTRAGRMGRVRAMRGARADLGICGSGDRAEGDHARNPAARLATTHGTRQPTKQPRTAPAAKEATTHPEWGASGGHVRNAIGA
ncbi:hypothetical protein Lesp02_78220 [Lentzea sp. NBRC 105346]|nr:hypothetical protein Lesp02_78220 [Lentzea sp. NBRC 105346]